MIYEVKDPLVGWYIFVLFSYIGEVLISVAIFVDNGDISRIIIIKFQL